MKIKIIIFFILIQSVVFGQFGPEQIIGTEAELPVSIMVADIDGDNFPDVLSGSRSTNGVSWYKNIDGLGNFGSLQLIINLPEIYNVHAADLNGDGYTDVIVSATSLDRILWLKNLDGSGTFGTSIIIDDAADNVNDAIA